MWLRGEFAMSAASDTGQASVWVVVDAVGEAAAVFSSRDLAQAWLEACVRRDIGRGYYGRRVVPDVKFEWRDGRLGFERMSFGVHRDWAPISEEIVKFPLDPTELPS